MSLFDTLKAELLEARKNKNVVRADTIRAVTAELEKKAKDNNWTDVADAETVKELKKQIDNQNLIIEKSGDKPENAHYVSRAKIELGILEPFMPKQLTEAEITEIINATPDNKDFKNVMANFKANHAGLFDGGAVRKIWTSLQ
jgi:hypothetical protein